jgi:hypothetical protein
MTKNGTTPTERKLPVYVVCEVTHERDDAMHLVVIDTEVKARTQNEAMDKVLAERPPSKRNVELAAFLAGSYKQRKFFARQEWTVEKTDTPPFAPPPKAEAEPVSTVTTN